MTKFWRIFAIFLFFLTVSLYRIDQLPGEWFGDISNVHEYVLQILKGDRPFYFFQSPGPLYHYLVAPMVLLFQGNGYETYKLASIVVSLAGLVGTFLFVAEISSYRLALIASLTMSFSFWYLVWTRLGNSQIVIPALAAYMSLFIARFIKRNKFPDLFLASIFASLGWYAYPQTFIFPAIFLLFVAGYLTFQRKLRIHLRPLGITFILMIVMAIPFITIVQNDRGNFGPKGYVGGKLLPSFSMPVEKMIGKTLFNYGKVFLMLHVRGDDVFRVNVAKHPQLDTLSGIFFLLGFLYFAKKKRRIWLFYILWMLLVLPLPSVSPALPEVEIPNSARTIAMVPFVFLLVAAGLLQSYKFLVNQYKHYKFYISIVFTLLFAYITFINLRLYFTDYAHGLPEGNFASGKVIANYIDGLPVNVNIYFGACCWGQWGHPEPKAVAYILRKPRDFIQYNRLIDSCSEVTRLPARVIFGPNDDTKIERYRTCFPDMRIEDFSDKTTGIVFKTGILK